MGGRGTGLCCFSACFNSGGRVGGMGKMGKGEVGKGRNKLISKPNPQTPYLPEKKQKAPSPLLSSPLHKQSSSSIPS